MTRVSLVIGALAAVTIVLGFLIQWVTITTLGPGVATDALFASLAIPQVVLIVVGNPIGHVLLPSLANEAPEVRRAETWTSFVAAAGAFVLMAWTLSLSAAFWVPILTGGFPAEGKLLAIQLAKVELIGMALIGSAVVARTAYHARGDFVWPAWAAVLSALAGLTYLVWRLPRDGVVAAAWSYTLRSVLECLLLLPGLGRAVKPNFRSSFQFEAWRRVRPLLLGYSYERSEMVLDRFLASLAPAGGLSLLYLGQQVWGAAGQIMNRAVALPITPTLARLAGRGDWAGFRQLYQSRLGQVFAICAVAVALLALVGLPSLDLVFGIRNMSEEDVRVLWLLMLLLFGLLIGDPSGHLLLTSFYAKGDTLTPTRIGIVAYSIGIGCKLLGFFSFGLLGLAAGTTIFYLARSWALWSTLNRSTPTRV